MASSNSIPCGPCQEGKVNTKADIWCNNCYEGLCSTCSGHHKGSKLSCDHKTIDIKSYKPSIQTVKTECDKHGQQLNLYCPSHLMPCCDECIPSSHSKCTGIISLASVVEKTKIEKSKESLDKNINSTLDVLTKMVKNKSGNIKRGAQQSGSIKERIANFRNEINKHLDQLEKNFYQETDTILNQEKSKASDFITEIDEKKGKLNEMKDHLHAVTTQSSKLESFLGVHQIEQQVHKCQLYVENLENDERAKKFDIKMKQNDEIENILRKLESLESLGKEMVFKTDIALNRETSVRTEAQVQSREQSNVNNMTMDIETEIDMEIDAFPISDMICLMDGRVLVVERWGKVNLFTSDGKLQKQLPIPGAALCVTQINKNTIAVTDPEEEAIKIFNMENETVTKVITLETRCCGLSFSNNSLAVGLCDDEIRIIDLEGNTLKSIQVRSREDLEYLVYCKDRVTYSDRVGEAVYCVDESGKQIWKFTQDLEGPRGLCTDNHGNIIVADYNANKIIVISKDGQNSKILMSKEDPWRISFKPNESSGFICVYYDTNLTKFNLSSG